jgi:selenium-binding protein 1
MKSRKLRQTLELGSQYQMTLELRPARDPSRAYGFAGVVLSLEDLSASVWLWYLDGENGDGTWKAKKVIEIPAEPAEPEDLPPLLRGFGAVPPLITDINLSLDDRHLFVSCWGTGELLQFDVSDPHEPVKLGSVRIGGIVRRDEHPAQPGKALNGGPQMVEVSRDGRRVYLTNSLYSPWDAQFYPDGIAGWMAKCELGPDGRMQLDPEFLVEFETGIRPHQVRLQGGDASSDSFCFS